LARALGATVGASSREEKSGRASQDGFGELVIVEAGSRGGQVSDEISSSVDLLKVSP
jgi:hypothetical protein